MNNKSIYYYMRIIHRYLGFFLAGIMAVYALSGIILIYRDTDFLKNEKIIEKKLKPAIVASDLGKELRIKNLKFTKTEGDILYFNNGKYNSKSGLVNYTSKELPYVLKKFTDIHKASSKEPLYWLNTFFGVALFFFVISSFWMFKPKNKNFTTGIYISIAGLILTLILMFV